jgi:general stress protein 26
VQASFQQADRDKVWNLIKDAHSAMLATVAGDGALQARPMGCLQKEFDGTLWFLTFRHSPKAAEIAANDHVLVSYADPAKHDYVSVTGRARILEDRGKIKELWNEGLRVWFPDGPGNPELVLLAVEVDAATYWTRAASFATYAWTYVRARLTGEPARAEDVADVKTVQF